MCKLGTSLKFLRLGALLLAAQVLLAGGLAAAADNQYVGAEKCKSCHNAPKKGDPHGQWLKSKHSKAFTLLASEEALKTAKAKNIAEPQKSADCLKCHVTAFEVKAELKGKKFDQTQGVQCESCHGAGGKHVEARMAAEEPEEGAADALVEIPKDEIVAKPTADMCIKCHNKESPNYKPFSFPHFFKHVAHLDPRKERPKDYLEKIPADARDHPDGAKTEFKK
jgi:hypothetical protein